MKLFPMIFGEVSFDGDRIVQKFDAPEQICKVGISVWAVSEDRGTLVYQEHGTLVRQIVSNFGVSRRGR